MNRFTVLYDACVLYPAPLRDLLLRLAITDLFRARWSDAIGADHILTFNLNDFPEPVLATHGISACHPDRFLVDQLTLAPDRVCTAIQQHRASLKNPPKTVEEYLKTLKLQGLPTFSQTVLDYSSAL